MKKIKIVSNAAVIAVMIPLASAGGVVSTSLTAPTTDVIASYDADGSTATHRITRTKEDGNQVAAENRLTAFTFRPDQTGYLLTSLTLRTKNAEDFSKGGYTDVVIALLEDTSDDGFGDSEVWSEAFTPAGTWAEDDYVTFSFSSPTTELTTNLHQFQIYFSEVGSRNSFLIERAANDAPSDDEVRLLDVAPHDGTFPFISSTSWSEDNAVRNPTFFVTAIPEPGTVGLFGVSGLIAMLLRRVMGP